MLPLLEARPEMILLIASATAGRASGDCLIRLKKYLKISECLKDGGETSSQVFLEASALLSCYQIISMEHLISTNYQIL